MSHEITCNDECCPITGEREDNYTSVAVKNVRVYVPFLRVQSAYRQNFHDNSQRVGVIV